MLKLKGEEEREGKCMGDEDFDAKEKSPNPIPISDPNHNPVDWLRHEGSDELKDGVEDYSLAAPLNRQLSRKEMSPLTPGLLGFPDFFGDNNLNGGASFLSVLSSNTVGESSLLMVRIRG
jgi:hypothetical protein